MPLPDVLVSETLGVRVNRADQLAIEHCARATSQSLTSFIRTRLDLGERSNCEPNKDEIENETDRASAPLRDTGVDPVGCLSEDDSAHGHRGAALA